MTKNKINYWTQSFSSFARLVRPWLFFLFIFYSFQLSAEPTTSHLQPSVQAKQLSDAIRAGKHQNVKDLLSDPSLANECVFVGEDCLSMLLIALEESDNESVKLLLNAGALVDGGGHAGDEEGNASPLMLATYANNKTAAKMLLEHGADLDNEARNGMTPVLTAALLGRIWFVAEFVRRGADLQKTVNDASAYDLALKNGHTYLASKLKAPLDWIEELDKGIVNAVLSRELWDVQVMIAQGADVNLIFEGQTLLNIALSSQSYDIADALKDAGADINQLNGNNLSALNVVVEQSDEQSVQWLLSNGANTESLSDAAFSPLVYAIYAEQHGIVDALLEYGADVNVSGSSGALPLEMALAKVDSRVSQQLLGKGALLDIDVDRISIIANQVGSKISDVTQLLGEVGDRLFSNTEKLLTAARDGDKQSWEAMLSQGVFIDSRDDDDFTALHHAAYNGDVELLQAVLDHNPLLTVDVQGYSPLMLAVLSGSLETVNLLIEVGLSATEMSADGKTALDIARENNQTAIEQLLVEPANYQQIVQSNLLWDAVVNGDEERLESSLDLGAEVDWHWADEFTALHIAARDGRVSMVKTLISRGADIDAKTATGWTPLLLAAKNRQTSVVAVLRKHGASRAPVSEEGKNALEFSIENNTKFTTQLIRSEGDALARLLLDEQMLAASRQNDATTLYQALEQAANIDQVDDINWQALHYATREGNEQNVRLLLEGGANVGSFAFTDEGERTALMIAAHNGYTDVVNALMVYGADPRETNSKGESAFSIATDRGHLQAALLLNTQSEMRDTVYRQLRLDRELLETVKQRAESGNIAYKQYLLQRTYDLVDQGASAHAEDEHYWTPLQYAARDGDVEITQALLIAGADANRIVNSDTGPISTLELAIKNNELEITRLLLEHTSDRTIVDNAINMAVEHQQADIATLLNDPSQYEQLLAGRELFKLVQRLRRSKAYDDQVVEEVESLLESGLIQANRYDAQGMLAAYYLLLSAHDYSHLTAKLLPTAPTTDELLDSATQVYFNPLMLACIGGNLNQVKLLLERGYRADAETQSGHSALSWTKQEKKSRLHQFLIVHPEQRDLAITTSTLIDAIRSGNGEQVTAILNKGEVEPNFMAEDGLTPMHLAVIEGQPQWLSRLIDLGGNVDSTNSDGNTLLMVAAEHARHELIQILLSSGAQPELTNPTGKRALSYAIEANDLQSYFLLLNDNSLSIDLVRQATELYTAVETHDYYKVETFFQHEIIPRELLDWPLPLRSPLHIAAENDDRALLELLLSHGFDPNERDVNGVTPLMLAATQSVESVNVLLKFGAVSELVDNRGQTATDFVEDEIRDEDLRELISDKLWLPMTANAELQYQTVKMRIEHGYPLGEFASDFRSKDVYSLSKTAIEYASVDVLNQVLSVESEPLDDSQIFALLKRVIITSAEPAPYLELLLSKFDDQIQQSESLQDQLSELCLENLSVCLVERASFKNALNKLEANITKIQESKQQLSMSLNYAQCTSLERDQHELQRHHLALVQLGLQHCEEQYPVETQSKANLVLALGHQKPITALSSDNKQWYVSGDDNGKVIVWQQSSSRILNEISLEGGAITHLSFVDGQPWIVAATGQQVMLWDIAKQTIRWQMDMANAVAGVQSEHLWLASGQDIVALDLESGRQVRRWKTRNEIKQLLFLQNELVAVNQYNITVWNRDGKQQQVLNSKDRIVRLLSNQNSDDLLAILDSSVSRGHLLSRLESVPDLLFKPLGSTANLNAKRNNLYFSSHGGEYDITFNCNEGLMSHLNGQIYPQNSASCSSAGPLIASKQSEQANQYLVAIDESLKEVKLSTLPSEQFSRVDGNEFRGYSDSRYQLCHVGNNNILLGSIYKRFGINLADRGLPPLFNRHDETLNWQCVLSDDFFAQESSGSLHRYSQQSQELAIEYKGFSQESFKFVYDNQRHNQVVVIGRRLKASMPDFGNDVVIYDRETAQVLDEFSAFEPAASRFPIEGFNVRNIGVRKAEISPNGQWLVLFNEREVLIYNLEKKVIAARRAIDGSDIAIDDQHLYIMDSELKKLALSAPWLDFKTLPLKMKSDQGQPQSYASFSSKHDEIKLLSGGNVLVSNRNHLYKFSLQDGVGEQLNGEHQGDIWQVALLEGDSVLTSSADASIGLWNIHEGLQAKLIMFNDRSWAVVHHNGLFDASGAGMEKIYFRVADKLLDIEQLKNRYFEPYLLQKVLGLHKEQIRDTKALQHVAIYPEAKISTPERGLFNVKVVDQGGGIGPLLVYLNNKLVELTADNAVLNPIADGELWKLDLRSHPFLRAGENTLSVVTQNAEGYLSSRGLKVKFASRVEKPKSPPKLYVVSVGVSDYYGDELDLRFSAKDAKDMEQALVNGAERLFGTKHTKSWLFSTDATEQELKPTKQNIQKLFGYLKEHTTSEDILILYFSGHGITLNHEESEYYFLTQNAYSTDVNAYRDSTILNSTTLSSSEIIELANSTSILKQVLILDTCASGQVVNNLSQARDLSSDALRALESVQSRTGMHVITGSTADAVSYEASQFAQGLLTYSLLEGMKGAALDKGSFVDVVKLFSRARERVPELAKHIGGIQQPVIFSKADSFYIGELDDNARDSITLLQPKPVFLQSTLMNSDTFDDSLNMERELDAYLRLQADKGRTAPLVFVESEHYPDGVQLRGLYSRQERRVKLNVAVIRGHESLGKVEMEMHLDESDDWQGKLLELVLNKLASTKT